MAIHSQSIQAAYVFITMTYHPQLLITAPAPQLLITDGKSQSMLAAPIFINFIEVEAPQPLTCQNLGLLLLPNCSEPPEALTWGESRAIEADYNLVADLLIQLFIESNSLLSGSSSF